MHRSLPLSFPLSLFSIPPQAERCQNIMLLSLIQLCLQIHFSGSGMGAAAVLERGDYADDLCNAHVVENHNFLSRDAK